LRRLQFAPDEKQTYDFNFGVPKSKQQSDARLCSTTAVSKFEGETYRTNAPTRTKMSIEFARQFIGAKNSSKRRCSKTVATNDSSRHYLREEQLGEAGDNNKSTPNRATITGGDDARGYDGQS